MIRWITDRLGTAAWDQAQAESGCALLDVRDLVDKDGNFSEAIRRKVLEGVESLQKGARLVVCCDYGMSRSNSIAAGILALATPMPFDASAREVCRATGETAIRVEVLAAVRKALEVGSADQRPTAKRAVLVTGAAGFAGAAFVSRAHPEFRFTAPDRRQLDLLNGSVYIDLAVREANVDTVVHLANPRIVTTNASLGESLAILKNVLDACRINRSRLVFLSCWEVFSGYRSSDMAADETTPLNPGGGTYSLAKYLEETLIEQYRRQFDLSCSIVRSSPLYGETGQRPRFIGNYISKALAGAAIQTHRYRNGSPRLDLLHVDDLADALWAIVGDDTTDTFHIGSGQSICTADIARMIVEMTQSASRIEPRDIDGFAPNVRLDATRLRDRFGWRPRIELAEGLGRIIEKHKAKLAIDKRGAA